MRTDRKKKTYAEDVGLEEEADVVEAFVAGEGVTSKKSKYRSVACADVMKVTVIVWFATGSRFVAVHATYGSCEAPGSDVLTMADCASSWICIAAPRKSKHP